MSAPTLDVAVYVGRFQPFHWGHLALLRHALEIAPTVVLVIGCAWQARTPKNPLTWQERAEMVRLALSPEERGRVKVLRMRDHYDEARWVRAVQREVADVCAESASVALVGHDKDATSEYLRSFQGWTVISVERVPGADGTAMRDALYGTGGRNIDATLIALARPLLRSRRSRAAGRASRRRCPVGGMDSDRAAGGDGGSFPRRPLPHAGPPSRSDGRRVKDSAADFSRPYTTVDSAIFTVQLAAQRAIVGAGRRHSGD